LPSLTQNDEAYVRERRKDANKIMGKIKKLRKFKAKKGTPTFAAPWSIKAEARRAAQEAR
jgi:hypothetical protein